MTENLLLCPRCGRSDQVEKVSAVYLASARSALRRQLAPPTPGRGSPVRLVHPDQVIALFTGVLLVFLGGVWTGQRAMFLPALGVLLAFYIFYFLLRKNLIGRFHLAQAERRAAEGRLRKGIQRWMGLYYCGRDGGVFAAGSEEWVPADRLQEYLLR